MALEGALLAPSDAPPEAIAGPLLEVDELLRPPPPPPLSTAAAINTATTDAATPDQAIFHRRRRRNSISYASGSGRGVSAGPTASVRMRSAPSGGTGYPSAAASSISRSRSSLII